MNPQNAHAHEDRLLDFAYGELPTPEARAMEAHLSGCDRCTQALDDIRGVRATMSQLSTEPAPDAGLESLMAYAQQAARRAAAGPAPRSSRWRRWLLPVLGLASVSTFGILVLEANENAPASPDMAQVAAKAEMAKAKDAVPARGVAAPEPVVAEAPAPAPPPPAQAAPSAEALLDEGAAKEVARADDWRNAGSGGGLDARIVREEEMKAKAGYGKGASERARASTSRQPLAKAAPSKPSKLAFGEKDAPDEESLPESAPRDAYAAPKQDGLKVGGASSGAQAADEDDGAYDKVFAGADAPQAVGSASAPAGPPATTTAAPASPSPSGGRADVATGALAQTESQAERRAPAPSQAPAKKAKRSEYASPAAAMPAPRVQAEPGPSVAELSSQARQAYLAGDRDLEAGLLRSALAAGPSRSERLGLLNRLCDAELALGRQAQGTAACKQVIADDPGSSAAQAARRMLSREPATRESAPKSAEPQK
jgi:hypothetical protein